jgi:thiol-disulfide isomerase/thioredoxin
MKCKSSLPALALLIASWSGHALLATGPSSGTPETPASAAAPAPAPMKVGDPAPPLKVSVFLKGEPIPQFEKGKLYLVEFWATWCTACKMMVPHLSQVARDFRGKITVLSVNVSEQGHEGEPYSSHLPKVRRFMDSPGGEAMDYTVAMDDDACTMLKTWLEPSGGGFPSAVLVDREGKVAWTGFPGESLGEVLELAVENRLSEAALGQITAREAARRKDNQDFQKRIGALMGSRKHAEALRLVEERIGRMRKPGLLVDTNLLCAKYHALTYLNPAEARKAGEEYLSQYASYPVYLTFFAMSLLSGEALDGGKYGYQDRELAVRAARVALDQGDRHNPLALQDLAKAYALQKDYRNAVKFQQLALDVLDDYGRGPQRKVFERHLKEFKRALKSAGKR